MRKTFAAWMAQELKRDRNAILLTGDLGFSFFDDWAQHFPGQYVNAGIAEQGMIGVASGLALGGKTPWVYSIAPFLILRAFEQIKLDVEFPGHAIRLVGVGAGTDYGQAGISHYSLEDLSLMATLPGFRVYCPETCQELEQCLEDLRGHPGPAYLRLANRRVLQEARGFQSGGSAFVVLESADGPGTKTVIVSSGPRTSALRAGLGELTQRKIALLHLARVQPLPTGELEPWLRGARRVLVLEDQFADCGLTARLSLEVAKLGLGTRIESLGYARSPMNSFGGSEFMRQTHGTGDETVWQRIREDQT